MVGGGGGSVGVCLENFMSESELNYCTIYICLLLQEL